MKVKMIFFHLLSIQRTLTAATVWPSFYVRTLCKSCSLWDLIPPIDIEFLRSWSPKQFDYQIKWIEIFFVKYIFLFYTLEIYA